MCQQFGNHHHECIDYHGLNLGAWCDQCLEAWGEVLGGAAPPCSQQPGHDASEDPKAAQGMLFQQSPGYAYEEVLNRSSN